MSNFSTKEWTKGLERQLAFTQSSRAIVDAVWAFMEVHAPSLLPPPAVSTGDDGSVQLEWHNHLIDLEVEFLADVSEPEVYIWFHDQANSLMDDLSKVPGDDLALAFETVIRVHS